MKESSQTRQPAAAHDDVHRQQLGALLTTSGVLDLYLLKVADGQTWVLPQTLVQGILNWDKPQATGVPVTWQDQPIPLVAETAKMRAALVIEGVQEHCLYAIALLQAPEQIRVRISAMKDVDAGDSATAHQERRYVYQYVKHDDALWIVPDLELLELDLSKTAAS